MIVTKYKCEECGTIHADEWNAEVCCPPQIIEIKICDKCVTECIYNPMFLDNEQCTNEECEDFNPNPQVSQRYLESRGQQTLFK